MAHAATTWFLLDRAKKWDLVFEKKLKVPRGTAAIALYERLATKLKLGALGYDLRAVLKDLGHRGWSGPVAKRLQKAGVPGVRKSFAKKRGGAKKGKCKRRCSWFISSEGLKRAVCNRHLKAKT